MGFCLALLGIVLVCHIVVKSSSGFHGFQRWLDVTHFFGDDSGIWHHALYFLPEALAVVHVLGMRQFVAYNVVYLLPA